MLQQPMAERVEQASHKIGAVQATPGVMGVHLASHMSMHARHMHHLLVAISGFSCCMLQSPTYLQAVQLTKSYVSHGCLVPSGLVLFCASSQHSS